MPFDERDFPNLPPGERAASPRARRMVAYWLHAVAVMIVAMVVLGGATRLTGSGLSIMEWDPIMGALPPFSDTEWRRLFALYQQIPQYTLVNDGFGLEGFKRIFWLEWTHRLWGRALGAVFLIPMIWFAATGRLERRLVPRLAGFFVLGGLQGAVGWFMVSSGFFPDATAVAPVRLVAHLLLALTLYIMVLWTGLSLRAPGAVMSRAGPGPRWLAWGTVCLTLTTIAAGGFVAGTHAGLTYNTFPLMDGRLIPAGYADLHPFARNLIENVAAVQFDHRMLATLTLVSATALIVRCWSCRRGMEGRLLFLATAAVLQYGLGIATLLWAVPVGLAVLHQLTAILLLTAALMTLHALIGGPRGTGHGQIGPGSPSYRSTAISAAAPGHEDEI